MITNRFLYESGKEGTTESNRSWEELGRSATNDLSWIPHKFSENRGDTKIYKFPPPSSPSWHDSELKLKRTKSGARQLRHI